MSYEATHIGTQYGRLTGKRYRLTPGHRIPAPPGDLYGLPGVVWTGPDPEPKPPPPDGPAMETVLPKGARSTDYTVAEVRRIVKNLNPQAATSFCRDDPRKSVAPPPRPPPA